MPRFHVVTRVVCNKCGRRGPGLAGEHDEKSAAVTRAIERGWTKRREGTIYQYDYYCPGCSAKMAAALVLPIMELSTDH